LPFLLERLYSILYADDTTLLLKNNDLNTLRVDPQKQYHP